MVLKAIKATEQKLTGRPLKNGDQLPYIVPPLLGSGNFCSQEIGRNKEDVVEALLNSKDYLEVHRNKKLFGVEVDFLVLTQSKGWVIVEVKSLSNPELWHFRLSSSQRKRLLYCCECLVNSQQRPVSLFLALVGKRNQVTWVPINKELS